MWSTDSLWFEIAIVSIVYAVGNICLGHFEEHTPRLRRVGKYILTLVIVCTLSVFFGRSFSMVVLALAFLPVLYIHGWYLPRKKGINGWTAEPRDKYYEFRGWKKERFLHKDRDAEV